MQHQRSWHLERILKEDVFGTVDLLVKDDVRVTRRVACGSWPPFSRIVARILLRRERRALRRLASLAGIPHLLESASRDCDLPQGSSPGSTLFRSWIPGVTLQQATEIPMDFFDHLDRLTMALHALGICHNDLHKEQNILVGSDGFPHLLDFQLSSVHPWNSYLFRSRAKEDLRHLQKHRLRYVRAMGAKEVHVLDQGAGNGLNRGLTARLWRLLEKPIYNTIVHRLLRLNDGEARRPREGPWPTWRPATGPRDSRRTVGSDRM